jgi:hypothetical protein
VNNSVVEEIDKANDEVVEVMNAIGNIVNTYVKRSLA